MTKKSWLLTSVLCFATVPAFAQSPILETPSPVAPDANAPPADESEIIVTATRRSVSLSDVPLAVSAVSGETMRNSGVSDIRGLNQLSASLNVSSSTSEAVGGVARIRGVGTVGDNPGLESSVATFIDGVYRSRSGVALSELGAVERIEVLRGPQGTLFGRNASAGLINIITEGPSFTEGGTAEVSYGNYDSWRVQVGLTGPISEKVAYRIDGVYVKRDGFMKDSNNYPGSSSRDYNDRNRYLVRGQLKFEPSDLVSIRLIADYAKRNENCCAATFLPVNETFISGGQIGTRPNSFAALERALGAVINDDPYARRVAVTPGTSFQSDVQDWGVSAEVNWDLGGAKLTSITAYRNWRSDRGQDGDFTNLDILHRTNYDQEFKTFTQELRLQGEAFDDKLDWLVGGYFADETLNLFDNLRFGSNYGLLEGCRVAAGAVGAAGIAPGQPGCLSPAARVGATALLGPLAAPLLAGLDRLSAISNVGATDDRFRQKDRTWALFTHNVFSITKQLSLTVGARYTHDRKKLDMSLASDSSVCGAQIGSPLDPFSLGRIASNTALPPSANTARILANNLIGLACANNIAGTGVVDGSYADRVSDSQWSGTAVLSFKPTDRLLTYASYSKGYKAGGFNLDRAGLATGTANVTQLRFDPETVDAFELGAKYRGRGFRVAVSAFYQLFNDFQLNTFNGLSFIVENIAGCSALNGGSGADSDLSIAPSTAAALSGACDGKEKAGVVSKGIELEGSFSPVTDVSVDAAFTYADTRYRNDITGINGRPLPTSLFYNPGRRLSNAPAYTATGGATWTPAIGSGGLHGLFHADVRYQSEAAVASDLLPEKRQSGYALVNARVGVSGTDQAWSIEFWAQNLFDKNFAQIIAGAPIQGSNSIATLQAGGATVADTLFIVFPGEPRRYGLTVRTKF